MRILPSFLSSCLLLPGHPEHGPFHVIRGLLNAFDRFPCSPTQGNRTRLRIWIMPVLAAFARDRLPFHVDGVSSNDELYAGDPAYEDELAALMEELMGDILTDLQDWERTAAEEGSLRESFERLLQDALVHICPHILFATKDAVEWLRKLLGMEMRSPLRSHTKQVVVNQLKERIPLHRDSTTKSALKADARALATVLG